MDCVGTMEKCLASLHIPTNWSVDKLREKLTEHQVNRCVTLVGCYFSSVSQCLMFGLFASSVCFQLLASYIHVQHDGKLKVV